MRCSILATTAAAALPLAVVAQTHGSGISGGSLNDRCSVEYVRENWGRPDSARLVAAVIWRGQAGWGAGDSGAAWVRDSVLLDSLRRADMTRNAGGAGTVNSRAWAWVVYDHSARILTIGDRRFPLPGHDSSLVLLVDRVDSVGGAPVITSVIILVPATADPVPAAAKSGLAGDSIGKLFVARQTQWQALLLSHATVRDFVGPLGFE